MRSSDCHISIFENIHHTGVYQSKTGGVGHRNSSKSTYHLRDGTFEAVIVYYSECWTEVHLCCTSEYERALLQWQGTLTDVCYKSYSLKKVMVMVEYYQVEYKLFYLLIFHCYNNSILLIMRECY